MANNQQLENAQGAFGYVTTVNTPNWASVQGVRTLRVRNMSTSNRIEVGQAVVFTAGTTSTAAGVAPISTHVGMVHISTIIGDPLFAGVAITSCAPRASATTLAADIVMPGPSSEFATIVIEGPVWARLTTAAASAPVAGDMLIVSNSTLSITTANNSSAGGALQTITTLFTSASGRGNAIGAIAGHCIIAGSTGSTGFLNTGINLGLVWVQKSVFRGQAANTTA